MPTRPLLLLALAALPGFCADWSPGRAAQYLDGRAQLWLAWPRANRSGAACISCHTALPYLLARPGLRRALGETAPTAYETALLDGVRAKADKTSAVELLPNLKPSPATDQSFGVSVVVGALVMALGDARGGRGLSAATEQALARMWSAQNRGGAAAGAWAWTAVDLDPWETVDSAFYGAALAALAAGSAPDGYQDRPGIRGRIAALTAYLGEAQTRQPLHNRLALLWASRNLRGAVSAAGARGILEELRRRQSADGGWTLESLGAWTKHEAAPPQAGSNGYATAIVSFTLVKAGVSAADPMLSRALAWLRSHQDPATGFWDALSMNKRYEPGSMQEQFMREAATAYAAGALAEAKSAGGPVPSARLR